MATFRFLFRVVNGGGFRSWTEQWYGNLTYSTPGTIPDAVIQMFGIERAKALSSSGRVISCRVNNVINPGSVRVFRLNLPGVIPIALGNAQDVVNVSRLVTITTEDVAKSNYLQRQVADGDVVGGFFTYAASGRAPYDNWLNYLVVTSVRLRQANFANTTSITSVTTATGVPVVNLSAVPPIDFAVGTVVNIKTSIAGGGRRIYTSARIVAKVTATTYEISQWRNGTCAGGVMRAVTYTYPRIVSAECLDEAARTRKTGGPVSKFRGRRSSRAR